MKVYAVDCKDGEPRLYFATKGEAIKQARASRGSAPAGDAIEVEEVTLVPMTKAAIVRLINVAGGYVDDSRIVATFPSTNNGGQL
jgi:hypothetical protein